MGENELKLLKDKAQITSFCKMCGDRAYVRMIHPETLEEKDAFCICDEGKKALMLGVEKNAGVYEIEMLRKMGFMSRRKWREKK